MTREAASTITNVTNRTDYRYDLFGRRISAKRGPAAEPRKVFIYDGERVIGELHNGVPARVYTWGADGLVSQRILGAGAQSYWYHYGPQGETRHVTNSAGTVVSTYRYTAYGVPLFSSGTIGNQHRYGGKVGYYTDSYSGAVLAGQRFYSPVLGRWLSRDPIKYDGGLNLYEYVGGNPVRYVDPSGEVPVPVMPAGEIKFTGEEIYDFADAAVKFGDGILLGYGPELREFVFGREDVSGFGLFSPIAEGAGNLVGGGLCGATGARGLAELSRFKRFRWLNQNRYMRFGRGRLRDGSVRPRVALGPQRKDLSDLQQRLRHLNLKNPLSRG